MSRRATHCTSGGLERRVTNGGAILRTSVFARFSERTFRMWIMMTLMAERTTLAFACWNWGTTRSQMCSLSCSSDVSYRPRAFKTTTRPHSEHSFRATRSLLRTVFVITNTSVDAPFARAAAWMSPRAATVLATT